MFIESLFDYLTLYA